MGIGNVVNDFLEQEAKNQPQNILSCLKNWLKEKNLDKQVIGEVALVVTKNFFGRTTVEGKLYHNTLYVKVVDQQQNIQLFLQKKQLLLAINEKIKKLGYDFTVKDVRGKYEL